MSIKYKLFGLPKTFDDFIDKVRRQNQKKVNVFFEEYGIVKFIRPFILFKGLSTYTHHYNIYLQAEKLKLKLNGFKYPYPFSNIMKQVEAGAVGSALEAFFLKEAINVAEKLQKVGLEATIDWEHIDKAKAKLADTRAHLSEMGFVDFRENKYFIDMKKIEEFFKSKELEYN